MKTCPVGRDRYDALHKTCASCRLCSGGQAAPQGKYKSVRTEVDGIKFHSKKEARYYAELVVRRDALKEVAFFLRQVPFYLPGNVKYVLDFMIFEAGGRIRYVDVKGPKTPMFIMKRKQVEAIYPIKIELA